MKKPELILHIGIHKTGSTSLQRAFESNNNLLNSEKIYYPMYIEYDTFGKLIELQLNYELIYKTINGEDQAESHKRYTESIISKEIADFYDSGCKKMLISNEEFYYGLDVLRYFRRISSIENFQTDYSDNLFELFVSCEDLYVGNLKRIKQLFKDFEIKVVCYLRRQDMFVESHYNQKIKRGFVWHHHFKNCKKYLEKISKEYNFPFHEWKSSDYSNFFYDFCVYYFKYSCFYRNLSIWADVFGKENLIIKPFEKGQFRHGLVEDFFIDILGINENRIMQEGVSQLKTARENERISRDLVEYLVNLNDFPKGVNENDLNEITMDLNNVNMYQNYFTAESRIQFLDYHNEGNERIAREFLGRKEGILFYNTIDEKQEEYPGLSKKTKIYLDRKFKELSRRDSKTFRLKNYYKRTKERVRDRVNVEKYPIIIGKTIINICAFFETGIKVFKYLILMIKRYIGI